MEGGGNPLRSLLDFGRMVSTAYSQVSADGWTACQEADMVIYSTMGFYVAPHIAEKLNLPAIGAYFQPVHRTRAFPSFTSPSQRHLGGILNLLTYLPADTIFWLPYRSAVNQFRQQLNLPPIPPWVNATRKWARDNPVIYGFSPNVVPRPPDWGDHIKITGYWFLDSEAGWQPPTDLADFLAAGPPPVFVGFGSISTSKPEETTELVLRALSRTGNAGCCRQVGAL